MVAVLYFLAPGGELLARYDVLADQILRILNSFIDNQGYLEPIPNNAILIDAGK